MSGTDTVTEAPQVSKSELRTVVVSSLVGTKVE